MNQNERVYEAPKAKIYRFDENEQILTASGDITDEPNLEPEYAANALNLFMGGTNTTIEKK